MRKRPPLGGVGHSPAGRLCISRILEIAESLQGQYILADIDRSCEDISDRIATGIAACGLGLLRSHSALRMIRIIDKMPSIKRRHAALLAVIASGLFAAGCSGSSSIATATTAHDAVSLD